MTANWHFKAHSPGSTIREPIAGAFFASDAVSEPGAALVREGIQNSLDAARDGERTLVRISLVRENEALDWPEINPYFVGAAVHYTADDNGLRRENIPNENTPRTMLIFEDFGTNGLRGDPETPYPPRERRENNFFHFFRAEGLTDKDPGKRGSWGLGKDTFFRASKVNTVFGLTVRDDDRRRLLMGKTVLKSHYVGDGYFQDGYFGIKADSSDMVTPIEDSVALDQFCKAFHLERGNDSGLSVVVPWLDPEITETTVIQAVFKNYFYAILSGDLEVMVETSGVKEWLDKDNFLAEARRLADRHGVLPIIELADWAVNDISDADRHRLNMPATRRGWAWERELFGDDLLKILSGKLRDKERIAIRVPVTVRKRDGARPESYFDVYIQSEDSNERTHPMFIRDGILISAVNAPPMRGIRALVIVNDAPLSEFLRQSENPSHTVWQGQQVKDDYTSGVGDLAFVVNSVRRICDLAAAEDKEEDKKLLADIFPMPGRGRRGGGRLPPQPRHFTIDRIAGGFSVTPGSTPVEAGDRAEIRVAYDVRRGSALSRYRTTDFRLGEASVRYQAEGAEIEEVSDNRMVVRITNPQFRVAVTGFDENRQIYVKVDRTEVIDADTSD